MHLKAEQSDRLHTNFGNILFIGTSYFGINRLNLPFLELFAATDPKWTLDIFGVVTHLGNDLIVFFNGPPLYFFFETLKNYCPRG